MQTTYRNDEVEAILHAGATDDRVILTVAITNNRDTAWSTESVSGVWEQISLVDQNGVPRLDSEGSMQVVTTWTLPPGKSIVRQRETRTRDEVDDMKLGMSDELRFITDPEEYREEREEYDDNSDENRPHFRPNLSLPAESDVSLTATARVRLRDFSPELTLSFTPSDLGQPIEPQERFDLADGPSSPF